MQRFVTALCVAGVVSASGCGAGALRFTRPGASLRYGEAATVRFRGLRGNYELRITVLAPIRARHSCCGGTTYIVHSQMTNLGGRALTPGDAIDAAPYVQTSVNGGADEFLGSGIRCKRTAPPRQFDQGVTWSSCVPYLIYGKLEAFNWGLPETPYWRRFIRWS